MTTPSRGGPSSKARAGSAPVPSPHLRVQHSAATRRKTLAVLSTLERAPDPTVHRDALADAVVELASSGLDYCFMRPLELAQAGFLVRQTASLGLAATQQVLAPVIRNIIGRMDRAQLLSVSGSIREMMS